MLLTNIMAFSTRLASRSVLTALPPSIHTGHVFTTLPAASEQLSPLTIDEHVIHFFFPNVPSLPLCLAAPKNSLCPWQPSWLSDVVLKRTWELTSQCKIDGVNFSTKLTHPETAELLGTVFLTRPGTLHSTGVWPALRQLRNKSFTMFFRIIFKMIRDDVTPHCVVCARKITHACACSCKEANLCLWRVSPARWNCGGLRSRELKPQPFRSVTGEFMGNRQSNPSITVLAP